MRFLVALYLTAMAVILQDCLVSSNCPFTTPPTCPVLKYYQLDGKCNNEISKFAGSEASPLSRYLSYFATGGKGLIPYKNLFGDSLPAPRKVSMELFPCHDTTVSDTTHLFTIFGNLLMFDMFLNERGATKEGCCNSCLGIEKNGNADPRVTSNCDACMPYHKPTLTYNLKCTDQKQGKNQVTHVIDASFMYSTAYYTGGQTNGKFNLNSGFLPIASNQFTGVGDAFKKNPLVMALYHVFLREHNKLVDKMTEFGEADASASAKKLLIGMFQHITYNEYLPMLLGTNTPVKSQAAGTRTYDNKLLPVISNSFSRAYELIMASMLRETVKIDPTTNPNQNLIAFMGDATKVDSDTEMTKIINGMLTEASLKIGRKIPCNFRNNCLYSDIVSVLTQDTRYLGIPPYFVFLSLTGKTATKFEDLPYHTTTKDLLKTTYDYIYDIDFLSGAFLETIPSGDKVGPTLKKLLEDEFTRLQKGDRFYYENPNVFTSGQLEEIRKTSMALLLCRNVDSLTEVKQRAFEMSSSNVLCTAVPEIDFCKYADISTTWSAFETSSTQCIGFKIEFRTCTSAKPKQCPCLGSPFKLTPCANNMVTPEMKMVLELLEVKLSHDKDAMYYYENGQMYKVEQLAKEMYKNMTQPE